MTTMLDAVADTRRMAYGSMGEQINVVASAYAANAGTLVLDMDVSNITQGMMLSGNLNVWFVKGTDPNTKTVYVIPGYDNSPKVNMTAGEFVYIKPRVTDWYIFEEVNKEILRLSSPSNGLYKVGMWEAAVDPTWQTYTIPAEAFNMIGMLRVRYRVPGATDTWLDLPDKAYRIQFNTDDGDSFIRLLRNVPSGSDIQFLYKAPFTAATALTDDLVTDCGLAETMTDLPSLGVLSSLMLTTETRRNQVQQQGDARRAQEVSGGYNIQSSRVISTNYRERVNEELARLLQRVPVQRSL